MIVELFIEKDYRDSFLAVLHKTQHQHSERVGPPPHSVSMFQVDVASHTDLLFLGMQWQALVTDRPPKVGSLIEDAEIIEEVKQLPEPEQYKENACPYCKVGTLEYLDTFQGREDFQCDTCGRCMSFP